MTRQGRSIVVGGWILMVILGMSGLIVPAIKEDRRLDRELFAKRAEASREVGGPEVITRLTNKIQEIEALSGDRMRTIPEQSDVSGLMNNLASELNRLGLTDREITTGAPQSLDEADSMPMSVKVKGPFPAVFEAVREIESLERLVRVQRFRASTDRSMRSEASRTGIVEAELLIDVFYSPREVVGAETKGDR